MRARDAKRVNKIRFFHWESWFLLGICDPSVIEGGAAALPKRDDAVYLGLRVRVKALDKLGVVVKPGMMLMGGVDQHERGLRMEALRFHQHGGRSMEQLVPDPLDFRCAESKRGAEIAERRRLPITLERQSET
jgi:hypothetical protein